MLFSASPRRQNEPSDTRGGNVTRRPKTSGFWLIAIYLPDGTRISRIRTLIGGISACIMAWARPSGAERQIRSESLGLGNLSGKVEMDMFGGLTKTSSRIAIAAALGLTLGGFAFKATPAQAADLGGDCCADLEERVAELEATTVRKGNKKVSVTLSGWVIKSMNWWDDGDEDNFYRRRQGLRPWRAASPSPAARRSRPVGRPVSTITVKHPARLRLRLAINSMTSDSTTD